MKRVIIPLVYEPEGIIIHRYQQLIELIAARSDLFDLLYHNGDIQRFCQQVSQPIPQYQSDGYQCSWDLEYLQSNEHCLYAKTYALERLVFEQRLYLKGFHRHRTALRVTDSIRCEHDLHLAYLLLEADIIIESGAKLRLSHVIGDGATITVKPGGRLELIDVEFSGVEGVAITIEDGGIISWYESVHFFDVHHHFKIEYARVQECGKVVDFTDFSAVIAFFEHSIIDNFELIGDIHSDDVFDLNYPVSFISNTPIELHCATIRSSSALRFVNIVTYASIKILPCAEASVILNRHFGDISIENVNECVLDMRLIDNSATIHVDSSTLFLRGQYHHIDKPLIQQISSIVVFDQAHLQHCSHMFDAYERELTEDEEFMGLVLQSNQLHFVNKTRIEQCHSFQSRGYRTVALNDVFVKQTHNLLNLIQCEIWIESSRLHDVKETIRIESSKLYVSKSEISSINQFIASSYSEIVMSQIELSNVQHDQAIYLEHSILNMQWSSFSNNALIVLARDESQVFHKKCTFINNRRTFDHTHGCILENLDYTVDATKVSEVPHDEAV